MKGVVVGVDGSPGCVTALRFAVGEARMRRAPLQVVGAWQLPVMAYAGGAGVEELPAALRDSVRDGFNAALGQVEVGDVTVERHILEGHPTSVLLAAAEGADLLVVGSRGRGGFASLLLGSTGHELAHHAPCPVVIVPVPHEH